MILVFDMDNTLVDEMGSSIRPGIIDLLKKLKLEGHDLKLWTNSKKDRAKTILSELQLKQYFSECIYREDYDPKDQGVRKDIRKVNGDILIDDDPKEIEFIQSLGKKGFLISSFRKGMKLNQKELDELYAFIQKKNSFFGKFF